MAPSGCMTVWSTGVPRPTPPGPRAHSIPEAMSGTAPSFFVQDQADVLAFLERHLAPARRIDTHVPVVFLTDVHAYKLKRPVRFPSMISSTPYPPSPMSPPK